MTYIWLANAFKWLELVCVNDTFLGAVVENGVVFKEFKLIRQSKRYILPPSKLVIRDKTKSMPIVSKINLFYVNLSETTYLV